MQAAAAAEAAVVVRDSERMRAARPPTAADLPAVTARRPAWLAPTLLGAVGALVLGVVVAVLLLGRGMNHEQAAAAGPTIEAQAAAFYEENLEAANAGRHAEVVKAVDDSGGRFERTTYGLRLAKLRESSDAKLAEERRKAEEARTAREAEDARKRAALDEALAAAAKAESSGDVAGAARRLREALALGDDAEVRSRLARIERALAAVALVSEGEAALAGGRSSAAKDAFEKGVPDALGGTKRRAEAGLAEARRRIALDEALTAIRAKLDARDWRGAWVAVARARAGGSDDPRLAECAKAAAKELAPKPAIAGPLGIEFVLVPGGTFAMGSDAGRSDERPVRNVTVSAFYLGRHEVTRAQIDAFRRKTRSAAPASPRDREPAVEVSWVEASGFCRHLSEFDPGGAAYRLPTEAEWEYAARGTSGRTYPWGDEPPGPKRANLLGRDDGFDGLAPVGSFPDGATPGGVADLIGNAAEWCADWYGAYPAGAARDPTGPQSGTHRAVRGGAFAYDAATWSRASARARGLADSGKDTIGFRVARALTAEERAFMHAAEGK